MSKMLRLSRRALPIAVLALSLQACSHSLTLPPKIVNFGPKNVQAGVGFHPQPGGDSSLWIKTDGALADKALILLDGTPLKTLTHDNIATALVPAALYARAGSYPLLVTEKVQGKDYSSNTVQFVVK